MTRNRIAIAGVVALAAALAFGAVAVAAGSNDKTPVRYSHAAHQSLGADQSNCRQCHALETNLNPAPPGKDRNHQPCNDSNCHASEFFAKEPTICVTCHEGSEPWVRQSARLRRPERSEFASDMSHETHVAALGAGKATNAACKKCHGDPYKGAAPQRGHATCAPCHGAATEPAMGNCRDCHELGGSIDRRAPSEWSVAALYDHKSHGTDPRARGAETKCESCHAGVAGAASLAAVVPPTMESCDGCHDGNRAFKTTGFGCYRCHSPGDGDVAPKAPRAPRASTAGKVRKVTMAGDAREDRR